MATKIIAATVPIKGSHVSVMLCNTAFQLYNETPDEMYYIPEKMERHGLGNYTYPTAYLVWGLNCFLNERRKSNEIFKWRR